MDYKKAGVDIEAGYRSVELMKKHIAKTMRPDVLGGIVEVISGKTFGSFLREELFEPLGMKDTGFFVPGEKLGRFAQSYERTGDGLLPNAESHLGEYYGEDVAFESGGAGLVSTLDDYSRFASMLTHRGFFEG